MLTGGRGRKRARLGNWNATKQDVKSCRPADKRKPLNFEHIGEIRWAFAKWKLINEVRSSQPRVMTAHALCWKWLCVHEWEKKSKFKGIVHPKINSTLCHSCALCFSFFHGTQKNHSFQCNHNKLSSFKKHAKGPLNYHKKDPHDSCTGFQVWNHTITLCEEFKSSFTDNLHHSC